MTSSRCPSVIAQNLDRSPAAARQLGRRARPRVRGAELAVLEA